MWTNLHRGLFTRPLVSGRGQAGYGPAFQPSAREAIGDSPKANRGSESGP